MADDERRRLLLRVRALEESSASLQRELAEIKQALRGMGEGSPKEAEAEAARPGAADASRARAEAAEARARAAEGIGDRSVAGERAAADSGAEARARTGAEAAKSLDLEFWLGGRGLLLIGVVALVVAVGLLLKYAFDQGWIGPTVRVLMGAGVGVAAIVVGDRLRAASYRVYGLWLAAGGFGAIYLSIWAAVALYALLPAGIGFVLMVIVVSAAAFMGTAHGSEAFAALAAFGGYLAPLLVQLETPSNLFGLAYLAAITSGGLWIAQRENWPYLATLAIAGGALMAIPGSGDPDLHGIYLVALSGAAFALARRMKWPLISLLTVVLGWIVYAFGSPGWQIAGLRLAVYGGGLWLVSLVAWVGVTDWLGAEERARREASSGDRSPRARSYGDDSGAVVMLLPPFAFYLAALVAFDTLPGRWEGWIGFLTGLALGAVYVALAVLAPDGRGPASRTWRWAIGFAFWLIAPAVLWSGMTLTRVWLVEGAALTIAGLVLGIVESRAAGLVALVLAVLSYIGAGRPVSDAAFISGWALSALAASLGPAVWAFAVRRAARPARYEGSVLPIVLFASGALFLGWGTVEIRVFYELLGGDGDWFLARELTISAFWMAYAATLLAAGFALAEPPVRWAGLGMALIAAGKVFLYDLSNLAQLYRIASFFALAIVLLVLAFLYQRLRASETPGSQ